ncbi:Protein of uncharacterised function (DUF2514) [Plesiomonas shigelloides]|uniref:DUF2514 family protein n=1 Tax=Plesiomonas shigelloides TaxID=703 RepID=UPI0007EDCAD6|nr:DUF2514 family protein [Plesiomonas shigelloides]SBT60191.1 Protein of uncharacterised function (DUF2514) [Plesiomonas shigelloides]
MISRRALLAIAMAVVALWLFSEWRYSAGEAAMNEVWQSRWIARDAADAEERQLRQEAARTEEQRRADAVAAQEKEANDELEKAKRDAAAAESRGLQQQLKTLRAKFSSSGSCSISGAAGAGKAEASITVLTELLGEADAVAGAMAEEADRARVAGAACERIYNSVTKTGD